jgi:hypothetical protein
MPNLLPTGRPRAAVARESLLLKSALVGSALLLASLLVATQEFYFSAPARSLSEIEAALRLTGAPALTPDAQR